MTETKRDLPAVLITGASSGIGEACAVELDRLGWRVFAGVRTEAAGQQLRAKASATLTPVMLDVTDGDSIKAAAAFIKEQIGGKGLAGLVNNAGISVTGPMELVPIEVIRRQLEVNVVGQIAVTQAMLPLLRIAKGRIVNIGSVNGTLAAPYMGPYAASKFAMEAITDVLRIELRSWGIDVSIVEPGPIATPIWEKSIAAADKLAKDVPSESMRLYEDDISVMRQAVAKIANGAEPVEIVVRAVVHALTARKPQTRYFLHFRNRFLFRGFRVVPDRIRDWFICRVLRLP